MESRLNQSQKAMTSLVKSKYKISFPEKQNTWSNLLNKKSAGSITDTKALRTKLKKNAPIIETCSKSMKTEYLCFDINYGKI